MTYKLASAGLGWEVHEVDKPAGETLQGWYPSKTKASNALRALNVASLHPATVLLARTLAYVAAAFYATGCALANDAADKAAAVVGSAAEVVTQARKERNEALDALEAYRGGIAAGFGVMVADGAAHRVIVDLAQGIEAHHEEHHAREVAAWWAHLCTALAFVAALVWVRTDTPLYWVPLS